MQTKTDTHSHPHPHSLPPGGERISDQDSFALLKGLIEVPSVSRFERPAVEFLRERAAGLGLTTAIDETGSFVAATSGDPLRSQAGMKEIVLLGHIDTVPGHVPVRVEGDLFYGRGTVDAKGPLAAFVCAAANVRGSLPAGWRVIVVGAVEEEISTSKGARGAAGRYTPKACVIGEPSGWDATTLGYKGRLLVKFMLARSVVHTAGPGPGVVDELHTWWSGVLERVAGMNAGKTGAFGSVQATLRSVQSGGDGLFDRVEAVAGFRLPPGVMPADIERLCEAGVPSGARLECTGHEVAHVSDRHNGLVRAMSVAQRGEGATPRLLTKTGTSDMNVVGPKWAGVGGCEIVAYGPGDSSLDHTPIEHVSITEYWRAIRVLERAIAGYAAAGAEGLREVKGLGSTTRV
jgi:LysW-gamma-L-lysine carboxypeptidase